MSTGSGSGSGSGAAIGAGSGAAAIFFEVAHPARVTNNAAVTSRMWLFVIFMLYYILRFGVKVTAML